MRNPKKTPQLMTSRTKRYLVAVFIFVVISLGNVAVLNIGDIVNIPQLLGASIVVQLLLIILIIFSLIIALRTPLRILLSIIVSALKGIESNQYIKRTERYFPAGIPWLKRRFSRKHPRGLTLTIGIVVAVFFATLFVTVAHAVITHSVYVGVDHRVVNLMPYIRTPAQNTFFSFFTFIATAPMAITFILLVSAFAWLRRQYWVPIIFIAAVAVQGLILELLKISVRRPRPDINLRILTETNFSFPSGHVLTATVVYGLAAYLLFRFAKSYIAKLLIVIGLLTLVGLVATSRVYFAVHYPTDVVASMLVGGLILTIFITAIEINQHFNIVKPALFTGSIRKALIISFGIIVLAGILLSARFTHIHMNTAQASPMTLTGINQATVSRLPMYSETLTGLRMEPINIIFVGTSDELKNAFSHAGWYIADPSTLGNTFHAFLSAAKNEQYLNAPVTPSYLDSQPETIAFEKPTNTNSLRQRHHTRIWKTNYVVDGQPVWVATASFDMGIGIGSRIALPTHHIDPAVDNERAYISASLGQPNAQHLKIVDQQTGHNASGDSFYTDGQAVLIHL